MADTIALYVSSADVSARQRAQLQHAFDTAQDFPEIDPRPGYVRPVAHSEWALGRSAPEILARHREQHDAQFSAAPIVVLDARTARDSSVLLVSPVLGEGDELEFKSLRIDASRVPGAAVNIQLANQDLGDVRTSLLAETAFGAC